MKTNQERINKILYDHLAYGGYIGHDGIKDPSDIHAEHYIVDDLGADSLDEVEVIMLLEEEFEVELQDDVVAEWKTVGDIYKYFEWME